jgi:PPP family 3-phenylpropionic acid transporter
LAFPYWRLSAFYLFYYACLGTWIPYWPLYVQYIGHSALVIGLTSAVFHSTRIIAPNIWGYISDSTGERLKIIRYGCFFAFVAILGMLLSTKVWVLTTVLLIFSFFWSAVLPQFEVLTLNYLGSRQAHSYGRVRLWGSVGFIAAVFICGAIFDWVPLSAFPWIICTVLLMLWWSSLMVPPQEDSPVTADGLGQESFLQIARKRHIWGYLIAVILMMASFGPYYGFFSILLKDTGYPLISVSLFWCVAVAAEVLIFVYIRQLYQFVGIRNLLLASIALAALRWVITGWVPENVALMTFAQALHAFSFAAFHACMIEFIRRLFPHHQHGKGQAMFNSLGYGAGSVIGALLAGLVWDDLGADTYFYAAGLTVLAFFFAYRATAHQDFHQADDKAT